MNLFAYGSLTERRTFSKVIGRIPPNPVPATLHGYRMYETTIGYPIVLPEAGAAVTGLVYYSLTQADWKRLDEYENLNDQPPAHHRKLVTLEGAHGRINAHVYVGNLHFFRTRIKK